MGDKSPKDKMKQQKAKEMEKIKQAQRDVLRAKATFLVPPHMPATGVDEQFGDVAWFVQVHTHAKGPDPNESWEIVVD